MPSPRLCQKVAALISKVNIRVTDHHLRRRLHSSSTSVLRISRGDLVKSLVDLALTIEDDTKLPSHGPVAVASTWTFHMKPRTSSEQASCTVSHRSFMQRASCSGSIPHFRSLNAMLPVGAGGYDPMMVR